MAGDSCCGEIARTERGEVPRAVDRLLVLVARWQSIELNDDIVGQRGDQSRWKPVELLEPLRVDLSSWLRAQGRAVATAGFGGQ